MAKNTLNRALTVSNILNKKYKLFPFEGAWRDSFGQPERVGTWFVCGNSSNGKTSFILKLIKELSRYDKILLNSLEEGTSHTLQEGLIKSGFKEGDKRLLIVKEGVKSLSERLNKHKSPNIVIIDSFQYTQLTYKQYIDFKEQFHDKLIIFTSHADGKNPAGRSAKSVMYDATLKIWVEGHVAFSKGRYIGEKGKYIIWEQGARNYWGEI